MGKELERFAGAAVAMSDLGLATTRWIRSALCLMIVSADTYVAGIWAREREGRGNVSEKSSTYPSITHSPFSLVTLAISTTPYSQFTANNGKYQNHTNVAAYDRNTQLNDV